MGQSEAEVKMTVAGSRRKQEDREFKANLGINSERVST